MLRMIALVAIGWIVGLSARALMPGKGPTGFWATTGVGVGGALIAVVIGRFAGWWHPGDAPGFILSLLGAIMLLALWRVLRGKAA
ncbi:MAG TPA: GlsB/YeaQ/YmgE family stress response membrane protein [Candidatus Eisenbacteria bacterium]|nr:GlsB/YeaQ/YmgE family stress response membrane protein [Candidatus Eisenbacteria bacterium]